MAFQQTSEKESQKLDKCLEITREQKKLWNMKVITILEKRLDELKTRERIETIQNNSTVKIED